MALSDAKVSFGEDFSVDNAIIKNVVLADGWFALFAAQETGIARAIIDSSATTLRRPGPLSPAIVSRTVNTALLSELYRQQEAKVLAPHGFTLESFRKNGHRNLSQDLYRKLRDDMEKVTLGVQIIVAGFDENGDGSLFYIEQGRPPLADQLGFLAIGAGQLSATTTMAFHADQSGFNYYTDLERCVYVVCDAKFMAESASGVGRSSFLTIHEKDKTVRFIHEIRIAQIRRAWKKYGAPRIPRQIVADIADMAYTNEEMWTPDGFKKAVGVNMKGTPSDLRRAFAKITRRANRGA